MAAPKSQGVAMVDVHAAHVAPSVSPKSSMYMMEELLQELVRTISVAAIAFRFTMHRKRERERERERERGRLNDVDHDAHGDIHTKIVNQSECII